MKKWVIVAILVLVITIVVVGVINWWNKPVVGKVSLGKPGVARDDGVIKEYRGEYLRFDYQNLYDVRVGENQEEGQLEKVALLGKGMTAETIMIVLSETNQADLEEISAIQMRKLNKDYARTENGFWKNDGTEFDYFRLENGRFLSVVMTVGVRNRDSEARFEELVNSVGLLAY